MSIVADLPDAVLGVDTHTDTHTAAVVDRVGAVLAEQSFPADPAGYARLIAWAIQRSPGPRLVWAVEGTRSHGTGLARALTAADATLVPAPPPPSAKTRRGGKSDPLDAVAAAHAVWALLTQGRHLPESRADGTREDLRILLACRRHDTDTRTATVNLLKSLILTADEATRTRLRGLSTRRQAQLLATLTGPDLRHRQLAQLAQRILDLDRDLAANHRHLHTLITQIMPSLLQQTGIGPVTAAILLTAWSHPGRCPNEAAFAALAGVSPIPVSSGRTDRHRLNPGGDRRLNSALHTIALTRRRCDPTTRNYIEKRRKEGKTPREATRSLKRYLARSLYRHMQSHTTT